MPPKKQLEMIMSKRKLIPVLLLTGFLASMNGCLLHPSIQGNGRITSNERKADNFDSVRLDGVADYVNIHQAGTHKVIVTTDSNIQDIVKVSVDGNVLRIDEKKIHGGFDATKLAIDVYMPEISGIILKGVGNIRVDDGSASDLELVLSGVGDIDARRCEAEYVQVRLSGVGDIRTWATQSLTGSLSGVGDIYYRGEPAVNSISKSGVGAVKKM